MTKLPSEVITVKKVLDLVNMGMTYSQIAEMIDVDEKLLSAYMIRNGVMKKKPNPHLKDRNNLKKLRNESGMSLRETAEQMQLSHEAVRLHEQNIKQPSVENAKRYAVLFKVKSIYEGNEKP